MINSYGFLFDSIVDAKANGEDGYIETTISNDHLGSTNALLACSKTIDKKAIIGDKISDDPLTTNNAPLAQNKVVGEEPFVGMQFEDDEGAYKFYSNYAQKIGFRVRKLSMGKCPILGRIQRREFCCARRMKGLYPPKSGRCDAHIKCRLVKEKFTVISFVKEHNHNLSPIQYDQAEDSLKGPGAAIRQRPLLEANYVRKNFVNQRNYVPQVEKRANLSFETLSWEPRAFLFHDFLSKEECEHLIQLSQPHLRRTQQANSLTGEFMISSNCTSFGASVRRGNDQIVTNIEKRIAEATFLPLEHGNNLYVMRYEVGQKIEPHCDIFNSSEGVATFLMYLSEVEEGGETIFPRAKGKVTTVPWGNEAPQKFKSGVVVKPKMGNAVLFWHVKPDGTLDPNSLHCGSPVIKGIKWCCTKFIHPGVYNVKKIAAVSNVNNI